MTDDINAISGEEGGYVPCNEVASPEADSVQDNVAIAGDDEGFVPVATAAAAADADLTDTNAVFGHGAAFVAKPCICCWLGPGGGEVAGSLGSLSWQGYPWVDSTPFPGNPDLDRSARWQLNLGANTFPAGYARSAEYSTVLLPLDPSTITFAVDFGIELPEPTNTDGRVDATFSVTVGRIGPTVTEGYSVTANMFKNTGAFDWASELSVTTPDGTSYFSLPGEYGELFVSTTMTIAISPTGITASAGGLTGSRSYTADTSDLTALIKSQFSIGASVNNGGSGGSPPWPDPGQCHVWADAMGIATPNGNCVIVPRDEGADCIPVA